MQQKEPSVAFVSDGDKLKQSSLLRTDQLQGCCPPNPIRTEQFLVQPGVWKVDDAFWARSHVSFLDWVEASAS